MSRSRSVADRSVGAPAAIAQAVSMVVAAAAWNRRARPTTPAARHRSSASASSAATDIPWP